MSWTSFAAALAGARIGSTFNQYAADGRLELRLADYLERVSRAELLLVGEAAGYRGARVSGLPFTSERQLTGTGPAEASATIVHRVLDELGLRNHVLLWNVVPTHPHRPGEAASNRRPTAREVALSHPFVDTLAVGRHVVPVGRVAEAALGLSGIRHPSHGGARAFRDGLAALV
jgi:uracil-DNA glycosylase